MDLTTFLLFAATTFAVVFSPGPAAIAVTAQGAGNGALRAGYGVVGVAGANAIYFVLSALGIASIIVASHLAFTVIKWVGVAYLVYLGTMAIFSPSGGLVVKRGAQKPARTLFLQGFVVEFANPKALLYFAAIVPQFINPEAPILPQIAIMGVTTLALDVVVYSVYAYLGDVISRSGLPPWIVRTLNGVAGGALLFAAFRMAKVAN